MNITKNKKGFTLVELLAVIVILALIMSIAIVSMTGIMEDARYSTYVDTARSIISGVRSQLLANNEVREGTNVYYFKSSVLENTGKLPFGGSINFTTSGEGGTAIGTAGIYRASNSSNVSCSATGVSYVQVVKNNNQTTFSICIGVSGTESGARYMALTTEQALQDKTVSELKNASICLTSESCAGFPTNS